MERTIVYPMATPADTDFLGLNRAVLVAVSQALLPIIGAGPSLSGFACTPGTGLTVSVAAGTIFAMGALDLTAYGSLPASATQVLKQGINLAAISLSCPAPQTAGQSIAYLVQVEQLDVDAAPETLAFYDSANPSTPYSGPGNTGAPLNTLRKSIANVAIKAGGAAATESQVTPAPDAGFAGAWVITVPYGATSITTGEITKFANAPFIVEALQLKISQATGDARYQPLGSYLTTTGVNSGNDGFDLPNFSQRNGSLVAATGVNEYALPRGMPTKIRTVIASASTSGTPIPAISAFTVDGVSTGTSSATQFYINNTSSTGVAVDYVAYGF